MSTIYLTHCSKEKSELAKASGKMLPPDQLYTDPNLQGFIQRCIETGSSWAILSDKFGIFFPWESHEYYEKAPSTVTPDEENAITENLHIRLANFDEIHFFIRRETFHPFYERVLMKSGLADKVIIFEDLLQITKKEPA